MDTQKIYDHIRIFGAVIILSLVWAIPALADAPPNDELHINSFGITSGELPAPLPAMPGIISMPSVAFPSVDMSALPVVSDERQAVETLTANRLTAMRAAISSQYSHVMADVASVRSVTENINNAIGDPMAVSVYDGAQRMTVVGMAQRMSQSVEYGIGYARAVSAIGPMGLDLIFVFVGIGWIIFVNMIDMAIRLILTVIGALGKALDALWKLSLLVGEVVKIAIAILDLLSPF